MARFDNIGICSACGKFGKIFNAKLKLCCSCAGKKGGTSKKMLYFCDKCHARVKKGQDKCARCGTKVDWSILAPLVR
jgi:DNA-directed RNA polymerase subunit RPC12/RpoP